MKRPEDITIEFLADGFTVRIKGYTEKREFKDIKHAFTGRFDEKNNEFFADVIKNAIIDVLDEWFYVKEEKSND